MTFEKRTKQKEVKIKLPFVLSKKDIMGETRNDEFGWR